MKDANIPPNTKALLEILEMGLKQIGQGKFQSAEEVWQEMDELDIKDEQTPKTDD